MNVCHHCHKNVIHKIYYYIEDHIQYIYCSKECLINYLLNSLDCYEKPNITIKTIDFMDIC